MKTIEMKGLMLCVPLYSIGVVLLGAYMTAGLFMFHIAVVPLIFKYSKTFRRNLIFANFVQWPPGTDFEDLSTCGIEGGRNLSIEYQSKVDNCSVKIGLWHILPKDVYDRLKGSFGGEKEELNKLLDEELATSKTPIVLYCHGNSNSRAAAHRIQLYKFFQQMNFHTIAFDYRGYGDSTNISPSEDGVVEDSLVVYEWLHNMVGGHGGQRTPDIFVWGHSLGTGISCHLLGNLDSLSKSRLERATPLPPPKGLILEAPFSNLADEVAKHPLSSLVKWLPYYETTFVRPFRSCPEHEFTSDVHLSRVNSLPVLILHARDDVIVPYSVGLKLYNFVAKSRGVGAAAIKLHTYEKSEGLGHKWIVNASDLSQVVGEFVKNHQ